MAQVSRTKIEALAALEDAYRTTLLAVQAYSDEEFEATRTEGGMSPKDILAHLTWWNWEAPSGLERIKKDEMPFWSHIDLDELNAGAFESAERGRLTESWTISDVHTRRWSRPWSR